MEAPQNPAGPFVPEDNFGPARRKELIDVIDRAPSELNSAIAGLTDEQLDTRYRNWSIRQIVHHLADSHVHSYIRFKWTLTEDHPTIKPYDEGSWSALDDSRSGDVRSSVALMQAVHARWVQLMRSMTDAQFTRIFFHPESNNDVSLNAALASYAWHCKHHTAQIRWVRQQHGW